MAPEQREVRDSLVRYGLLSHALVFKQGQGESTYTADSEFMHDLQRRGLLTQSEALKEWQATWPPQAGQCFRMPLDLVGYGD